MHRARVALAALLISVASSGDSIVDRQLALSERSSAGICCLLPLVLQKYTDEFILAVSWSLVMTGVGRWPATVLACLTQMRVVRLGLRGGTGRNSAFSVLGSPTTPSWYFLGFSSKYE